MKEKYQFKNFAEFYPYYLFEHQNPLNKFLHFFGSALFLALVVFLIVEEKYKFLLIAPALPYAFAWFGHFIIEKNRPATFVYPIYSLMGDWVMFYQLLTRKIGFDYVSNWKGFGQQ